MTFKTVTVIYLESGTDIRDLKQTDAAAEGAGQQANLYSQPIRKALKTPEFVSSEAIYFRMKKAPRHRTGSKALCAPLTKTFPSRQHLLR